MFNALSNPAISHMSQSGTEVFETALSGLTDPVTVLVWAVLLDLLTRLLLPIARDRLSVLGGLPAGLARFFENKLNRPYRSDRDLTTRGVLTVFILIIFAIILGFGLDLLYHHHKHGGVIAVLYLFLTLGLSRPWPIGIRLIKILKGQSGRKVQQAAALFERYNLNLHKHLHKPDIYAMSRIYLKEVALSFERGLMVPAFWFAVPALFGSSGFVWSAVAVVLTEAARTTQTAEISGVFIRPLHLMNSVIRYIPSRIAALMIWLGAVFTPGGAPLKSIATIVGQGHYHRFTAYGWPLAAVAGALDVALSAGSDRSEWIGPQSGSAKVNRVDVRRALWLHVVTTLVSGLLFAMMVYLSIGL